MADDRDIFGRKPITVLKPVLADMCTIIWSGAGSQPEAIAKATNIGMSYAQGVTRRRTLGGYGNVAVIIPSQPQGSLSIARLYAEPIPGSSTPNLFDLPGWNICKGLASLKVSFSGASNYQDCTVKGGDYFIDGATVTAYGLTAEAEGLTVVDNIQIDFLQLRGTTPN